MKQLAIARLVRENAMKTKHKEDSFCGVEWMLQK
jgi:hypothetical protein